MSNQRAILACFMAFVSVLGTGLAAPGADNLLADGSFEESMPANQFGHVFKHWGGWKYEGECEFRVGRVAHSGKTSCLLFGASAPKIRVSQSIKDVAPGRYRVTAWIRGLDIGQGVWKNNTEFAFDEKYIPLKKGGTFGWTPLTYVADVKQKKDVTVGFGLWASGYFWVDDVTVSPVGAEGGLTDEPALGQQEKPVEPPTALGADAVRCTECGYRNAAAASTCYACGTELLGRVASKKVIGPATRPLASFDKASPFEGGKIVAEHAASGGKSLRVDNGFTVWNGHQDWTKYDYLKIDLYTDSDKPMPLGIEMADEQTRDYWTRVNYQTLVPPGASTLVVPLDQLYVGEKGRPGRKLILSAITRFVLIVGDKPAAPVFFSNLRLERDDEAATVAFDGLHAFDFGSSTSPLMPGFTRIDPSTLYSKGRGYGLKDAQIWRVFDALQPEPLYQDFICIERGGLAVDVPSGRYHVFVNIDNPSGFWGEYQNYHQRQVLAQGKPVVTESMTFDSFRQKYFRHWDTEDLPADDTFDKYQKTYFNEKEFDVDVTDGQLRVDFLGESFACSVSALIVYPESKSAEGKRFLDYVVKKRRFFFDNYFHRVLHRPTGDALQPTAEQTKAGLVAFTRDGMADVYYNDTPKKQEIDQKVTAGGFAGQHEPLNLAVTPLADLGKLTLSISDLTGPGTITAKEIAVGYVSYRLTRESGDGAVYTIAPRMVIPRATIDAPKGVTRRFWLTVRTPADAKPGLYHGQITLAPEHGAASTVPVEYRVYPGTLDAADIPVGPFSHTIDTAWYGGEPVAREWNLKMEEASLRKLHDEGFTSFTGMPSVSYLGFKDGKPLFDFTTADRQMELARRCGFTMPVVTYVAMPGLNLYFPDEAAMKTAGFTDYPTFLKAVFSGIQAHATAANWLPVYWNLGDEPVGDDVRRAAENAEAYRAAFPSGPPWFTAPTSFSSGDASDPHLRLAKALHAGMLNDHNEQSVRLVQQAGSSWAFYNDGNRWTYGSYLYKAAKQFGMKFRVSWHWNATAGDPYYALDCREDDYAWCNTNADGELIPSLEFEREYCAGLNDYRCLITLARLAAEKNDAAAKALIDSRMAAFHLGDKRHDAILPTSDWSQFRTQVYEAIARLRTAQ